MAAPHECSICNEDFDITIPTRQALCLPCGHTACRCCLSHIKTPHCPSCRASFFSNVATMAPNYTLHEVLAASSSSSVSSLGAVAAQVAVISSQVAAQQLDNIRRDVVTAAIQEETHTMHLLLQSLSTVMGLQQQQQPPSSSPQPPQQQPRLRFTSTQATLPLLNGTASATSHTSSQNVHSTFQLPRLEGLQRPSLQVQQQLHQQQQQAEHPQQQAQQRPITPQSHQPPAGLQNLPTASYVAVAQTANSYAAAPAPAPALSSTNGNISAVIPSLDTPNPILYVDSQSLEELFSEINSSTVPTTFDLRGRTLYHQLSNLSATDIIITASNITVRNGTIHHSDKNDRLSFGLHVQGLNVRLESIILQGGSWGLLVLPGGSAKLSRCSVLEPHVGLGVGDFGFISTAGVAQLEATDVTVVGCAGRGLSVGKGGQAKLQGCEFKNGYHHGMYVGGDASSRLTATNVRCNGNMKKGLCVIAQGKANLSKCNMTGNTGGSLYVQELQSVIKQAQCVLDSRVVALHGGFVHEVSSL